MRDGNRKARRLSVLSMPFTVAKEIRDRGLDSRNLAWSNEWYGRLP